MDSQYTVVSRGMVYAVYIKRVR